MYGFDLVLFELEFPPGAEAQWWATPWDDWTEEPEISAVFHDLLMDGNTWVTPPGALLSDAFVWVGLDRSCVRGESALFIDDEGPQGHLLSELFRLAVQRFGATGAMVLLFREQHGQFGHYVLRGELGALTVVRLEDEDAEALVEKTHEGAVAIANQFV